MLANTPLIAYGQSIGGAVAIYTVSRNEDKFSALILENTFLNMVSLEIISVGHEHSVAEQTLLFLVICSRN